MWTVMSTYRLSVGGANVEVVSTNVILIATRLRVFAMCARGDAVRKPPIKSALRPQFIILCLKTLFPNWT